MERFAFVLFLLAFSVSPAVAEESSSWFAKLYGGSNFLSDSPYRSSTLLGREDAAVSFDNGVLFGGAVGYSITQEIDLELDYLWRRNDIRRGVQRGGTVIEGGDVASVAILLNGFYRFQTGSNWRPYLGVGVGILQEIDSDLELAGDRKREDLEDTGFAWQGIAGVEYELVPSLSVFSEYRYLEAPSVKLSQGSDSLKLDYQNNSITLGARYQF